MSGLCKDGVGSHILIRVSLAVVLRKAMSRSCQDGVEGSCILIRGQSISTRIVIQWSRVVGGLIIIKYRISLIDVSIGIFVFEHLDF